MIVATILMQLWSGYASRRRIKIARPRIQNNPAGIHLNSAGRCSDNRSQFSRATVQASAPCGGPG